MGLFDKKYCDVCGDKIGLLGNRKLEDGNLCKNCAAKLSPWFTGRRHSELESIKSQLDDREANKARVASFNKTKKLGKDSKALFIDTAADTFAICYESDFSKGNPDILPLSCIRSAVARTEDSQNELKRKDNDGKMVSYNPPKYEYCYDFYIDIEVDHPYIEEMSFQVNDDTIKKADGVLFPGFDRIMREHQKLSDEIVDALLKREAFSAAPATHATIAGSAAAAGAGSSYVYASGIGETDFTGQSVFYDSKSPELGETTFKLDLVGRTKYNVVDKALYDANVSMGSTVENALFLPINKTFIEFSEAGVPIEKLLLMGEELSAKLSEQINASNIPSSFGIKFFDVFVSCTISNDSKPIFEQYVKNKFKVEAAKAGLVGQPDIPAPAAAPASASGEWVCPACQAKNAGGNFCEYCGTARA